MHMTLDGKIAIVTGTSPNIGGGIAEGFAAAGAAAVCVDSKEENARDCAQAIVANGARALAITCDVTDEWQVEAAVARTCDHFGGIDILVNGAAFFNRRGVLDMPLDQWQKQLAVILGGTFLFTKHAAQAMIERSRPGSIINISSTAGHQGEPHNIAYCTGKSGLLNFTRSAAMELIAYGIRVNSLTPTATDPSESIARVAQWGRKVPDATRLRATFEPFRSCIAMQRLPSPSDYARAAIFLASDDAKMITGMDLRVDAGAIAQYWAWDPSAKSA
jgi:NAD(P)-dependent dehydrogenase (short-subunit alcohol dehydrogenase family)